MVFYIGLSIGVLLGFVLAFNILFLVITRKEYDFKKFKDRFKTNKKLNVFSSQATEKMEALREKQDGEFE